MKVVADPDIEHWVNKTWSGGLEFDENNVSKMAKHKVTPGQIWYLFSKPFVLAGKIVGNFKEPRYLCFGETNDSRCFSVIFTIRGALIRPICSRRMRPNEEKAYKTKIGVDSNER